MNCQALRSFILLREMKILLNDDTIKLNAKAQTSIFEMVPENSHLFPPRILKISSAQNIITVISKTTPRATTINIETKSSRMLCRSLFFSETRCSRTLEIEVAIKASGIDNSSFDRLK
jgi:hypothetical protein